MPDLHSGRAYDGPRQQTQTYVNECPGLLENAIRDTSPDLKGTTYVWTSPLDDENFEEFNDDKLMKAVGYGAQARVLRNFWPKGGPFWDAIAHVRGANLERPGILLADVISEPGELISLGCTASSAAKGKIRTALAQTRDWIWDQGALTTDPTFLEKDWMGTWHTVAARLAHVCFFREELEAPCWLAFVCLVDPEDEKRSAFSMMSRGSYAAHSRSVRPNREPETGNPNPISFPEPESASAPSSTELPPSAFSSTGPAYSPSGGACNPTRPHPDPAVLPEALRSEAPHVALCRPFRQGHHCH
jgi:hypothetical protein